MDSILDRISIRNVIGLALGVFLLTSKSKLLRYGLLAGIVAAYFLLPADSEKGRAARQGIADLTERWPGIGGIVSRKVVK